MAVVVCPTDEQTSPQEELTEEDLELEDMEEMEEMELEELELEDLEEHGRNRLKMSVRPKPWLMIVSERASATQKSWKPIK